MASRLPQSAPHDLVNPPPVGRISRLRALAAEAVYRPVPAPTSRAHLLGPLVFALATLVALVRVPVSHLDTMWAEDGDIFLQDALDLQFAEALLAPYSGYIHVYPRLSAGVAALLPLDLAGVFLSVAAAAVVGLAAWAVWALAAGHIPSPWLRAGLATAVVLVPAGGLEAVNSIANSHFFLMFAAFWALVGRRPGASRQLLPVLIVVLAALSDPVSVILLPLAVGRLALLDSWRDRSVGIAYLVSLAVQLWVVAGVERATGESASAHDIAFAYALRVVSPSVLGLDGTEQLVATAASRGVWGLAGVVGLTAVAALVLLPRQRLLVAAGVLASLAFFVATCIFALGGGFPPTGELETRLDLAARYSIVPALLLLSAAFVAAQGVVERYPGRAGTGVAALALLPVLIFAITDFRSDLPHRAGPPQWSDQVAQATKSCANGRATDPTVVQIAPGGAWHVDVDCGDVRD